MQPVLSMSGMLTEVKSNAYQPQRDASGSLPTNLNNVIDAGLAQNGR
jgi:hypothetical protein